MPFEIREGKLELTYLGSPKEVSAVLRFLRKNGIHFKVRLISDAKFSATSPLNSLTDKQRKVILTAFNLGYYDIPRKIRSNELAARLGIGNPTFVMHRRKAKETPLRNLVQLLRTIRSKPFRRYCIEEWRKNSQNLQLK